MPNEVRLDLTLDDYEFVGETEVEVEYHRYIGLITYVNTVNGQTETMLTFKVQGMLD